MKRFFLSLFLGWMLSSWPTNVLRAQQDNLIEAVRIPQFAQETAATPPIQPPHRIDNRFNLEMGMDVYTSYGLNESGGELPEYFYSYNRQGEVNLNLGYLRGSFIDNRFKAHLGLMAGTYANANLAAEPGTLRNLLEAYVGVSLNEGNRTWIEAGVFDSHIGFESPIGFDQLALTRGILSENTPYYLSGIRLLHRTKSGKWHMGLLVLNGWQMIQKPNNDPMPAFGHTLTYVANDRWSIHSNSYVGPHIGFDLITLLTPTGPVQTAGELISGAQVMHDLYVKGQIGDRTELIAGFDAGLREDDLWVSVFDYNRLWFAPSLVIAYKMSEKSRATLRFEHFNDTRAAIIGITEVSNVNPLGLPLETFQPVAITGASINYDYNISAFAKWRFEARGLYSEESIFPALLSSTRGNDTNILVFFTTSLAVRLFK